MLDGRSSFKYLNGDSVGGYIRRFFFPIGKYFKKNP